MQRKYWLDLFTGKTWEEFLKAGGNISGYTEKSRKRASKVEPGDYFICYLTGLSRIIGVLEVKSKMFFDHSKIWEDHYYPCRFKVETMYKLEPQTAVPIKNLQDKLSIFQNLSSPRAWSGFFRGSLSEFKNEDAEVIIEAVKDAIENPIIKEYDKKKYWRKPKIYSSKDGKVTIPDDIEEKEEHIEIDDNDISLVESKTTHEEIQWLLLKLGSDLGLDVWVARNDKNRILNNLGSNDKLRIRKEIPRQFDEATNKTIELIDVLWLQGDTIVAAFEVEHTSAIYSGLLRMSDLISMQPNIKIDLYIVASDDRADKVFSEINRPTFSRLKPPLPKICRYIPYSKLKSEIKKMGDNIMYLRPDFINAIAISCEADRA